MPAVAVRRRGRRLQPLQAEVPKPNQVRKRLVTILDLMPTRDRLVGTVDLACVLLDGVWASWIWIYPLSPERSFEGDHDVT